MLYNNQQYDSNTLLTHLIILESASSSLKSTNICINSLSKIATNYSYNTY